MDNDSETYGDYSVDDETQLSLADTLIDDDVEDQLDRGYSPPERYSGPQHYGTTPWEEEHRETIDQRLGQEVPEGDPYDEDEPAVDEGADWSCEAGDQRAGRLCGDTESDVIGHDVGIDGAAASAEEAAVHILSENDLD
jgi:hypothetical protein